MSFDSFSLQGNFINNKCDSDIDFYHNNVSNAEANYFLMTEVKSSLNAFDPNNLSVPHLNIRSMKKNVSVSFSAICLSEIWCES